MRNVNKIRNSYHFLLISNISPVFNMENMTDINNFEKHIRQYWKVLGVKYFSIFFNLSNIRKHEKFEQNQEFLSFSIKF